MAQVFAPFVIDRTIGNLTFYRMEGRNFVRKKSRLNRKQVLHSPKFERTRHFAGLMAKASRIGSQVYNALPPGWRQFWMYRSFTSEALKMLKAGKQEEAIQQFLWNLYVKEVASKSNEAVPANKPAKRVYNKRNHAYWKQKTIKAVKHKARKQLTLHYAGMMARASKIASSQYRQLPLHCRKGSRYYKLVAQAMQLLRKKEQVQETGVKTALAPPVLQVSLKDGLHSQQVAGYIRYSKGHCCFITVLHRRFSSEACTGLSYTSLPLYVRSLPFRSSKPAKRQKMNTSQ